MVDNREYREPVSPLVGIVVSVAEADSPKLPTKFRGDPGDMHIIVYIGGRSFVFSAYTADTIRKMEELYGSIVDNIVLVDGDGALGFSQDSSMSTEKVQRIRETLSAEWSTHISEYMMKQNADVFSMLNSVTDGSDADEGLEYEV
jgi:hypothetical protein